MTQLDQNDRRLLVQLLRDLPDSRTSRGQQAHPEMPGEDFDKSNRAKELWRVSDVMERPSHVTDPGNRM
jgi:hypothetical protein